MIAPTLPTPHTHAISVHPSASSDRGIDCSRVPLSLGVSMELQPAPATASHFRLRIHRGGSVFLYIGLHHLPRGIVSATFQSNPISAQARLANRSAVLGDPGTDPNLDASHQPLRQ